MCDRARRRTSAYQRAAQQAWPIGGISKALTCLSAADRDHQVLTAGAHLNLQVEGVLLSLLKLLTGVVMQGPKEPPSIAREWLRACISIVLTCFTAATTAVAASTSSMIHPMVAMFPPRRLGLFGEGITILKSLGTVGGGKVWHLTPRSRRIVAYQD